MVFLNCAYSTQQRWYRTKKSIDSLFSFFVVWKIFDAHNHSGNAYKQKMYRDRMCAIDKNEQCCCCCWCQWIYDSMVTMVVFVLKWCIYEFRPYILVAKWTVDIYKCARTFTDFSTYTSLTHHTHIDYICTANTNTLAFTETMNFSLQNNIKTHINCLVGTGCNGNRISTFRSWWTLICVSGFRQFTIYYSECFNISTLFTKRRVCQFFNGYISIIYLQLAFSFFFVM